MKTLKKIIVIAISTLTLVSLASCSAPSMTGNETNQPGATDVFNPDSQYRYQKKNTDKAPGNDTAPKSDKPVLDAQGQDSRDINVIVDEVLEGKYANGEERRKLLGDRYDEVQKLINQKCVVEKDPRCAI